jgi:nucleoside-diphosphate-sugar epimerase
MATDYSEPINIGSEEMVSVNQLVEITANVAGKIVARNHKLDAPVGVRGRNSSNALARSVLGWDYSMSLRSGIENTYRWINEQAST